MAVVITKDIKKKRFQLAIAVSLILVAFLIIYLGFFRTTSPKIGPAEVANQNPSAPEVSDINIKIFDDARFKSLQNSPGVPLATTTESGKLNPFSD